MNVLLVAHHCNPEWGSEPLIGFKWYRELQRQARVTLVTHVRNKPALQRWGGALEPICYVDTEATSLWINRLNDRLWPSTAVVNRLALETISQLKFDAGAYRIAERLCEEGRIDLIHRVSPISPRYPSRLASLPVPFILGPVNGGVEMPPGFHDIAAKERAGFQMLRGISAVLEWVRPTLRRSARILLARKDMNCIPKNCAPRCVTFCENGVDLEPFLPEQRTYDGRLKLLSLGRLLPFKGVDMLLEAAAALPGELNWSLDIVGDGVERGRLEQLAQRLKLGARVSFHGAVPVKDVPRWFNECDVFCLPSVRESGGSVVLEAMAAGKPVIVADHGGPAETVGDGVGIRVSVGSRAALIDGFTIAIRELASNRAQREALGRAARKLIERDYAWSVKSQRMVALYEDVLRSKSNTAATAERRETVAQLVCSNSGIGPGNC